MKKTILTKSFQLRKPITAASLIFIFITVFAIFASFKPTISVAQEGSEIVIENSSTKMGEIIPIKVKANAVGSDKCFVLTLSSVGAGLSEEYSFDENNKAEITDDSGKTITLNKYVAGDGAVNYWFELNSGESSEFSLNCTSGIYVATEHDINDYEPKTTLDENGNEITLSEDEIIEMIKSEKQAENENSEKLEMRVFFGSGENFESAMTDSSEREDFLLEWNVVKGKRLAMRSSFASVEKYVDSGTVTDTISWTYTKNELTGSSTLTISGTGAMPDYSTSANTPWYQKGYKCSKIVIEDGITRIGSNSLNNLKATSFSIGKDVTSIGYQSLSYNYFTNILVPGNVKTIENSAFCGNYAEISSVVLEEGIETIGYNAFFLNKFTKLQLPSTIKSIEPSPISTLEEISIDDDNDNGTYYIDDGVLFKRLDDGGVQLVWYPAKKAGQEYTIPSFVTNINSNLAFNFTTNLKKVTIPSTVTATVTSSQLFYSSALEELIIEDGVVINQAHMLSSATNLRKLVLPENCIKNKCKFFYFSGGNQLEEVYIPKGVGYLLDLCLGQALPNLERVYFDAANAFGAQVWSRTNKYELIIGKNVDKLYDENSKLGYNGHGFQMTLAYAGDVKFVGPNQITIEANVFDDMPAPLNNLSGSTIWVDEQGVVYKYDKIALTASVAYVPYGVKNITIPKTITPETDVTCVVNEVCKDSFKLAVDLTSVSFQDPSAIEIINAYGFANCSKLASVNGVTTEEGAKASFTNPNVKIGSRAFMNTALISESGKVSYEQAMNGKSEIHFENDKNFLIYMDTQDAGEWITNGENGGYKFLTGQNANINIQMQQGTYENAVYRIYFEFSDSDGFFSIEKGQTLTFDDTIKAECYATEADNICYVDFTNYAGATATALITANYISPTSAGGELKIWGFKLTKEEAEAQKGKLVECSESTDFSDSVQAYWTTQPDDFIASKTKTGTAKLYLVGDGNGNIVPDNDITWTVSFTRTSDNTLSVGKDFVKSVDFYDYVVLPEYLSWNPAVITAIKNQDIRTVGKTIYAGNIKVASIASGYSFSVEWSEEKQTLLFHWRNFNTSTTNEIGLSNCSITIGKEAICTDSSISSQATGTEFTITNNIYSTVHYTYNADKQTALQQADAKLILKPATLEIAKSATKEPSYFGEDTIFKITLKNTGSASYIASEKGSYRISDTLPVYFYIKPENIEKMMRDEFGKRLTVKISNAMFSTSKVKVTAYDGTEAYKNAANSTDIEHNEGEITISWNGDSIQLTTNGNNYIVTDSHSLKDIFEELGFYDIYETKYILNWYLNDSDDYYTIHGGKIENYLVYATFKNTFQLLKIDRPNDYSNTKYFSSSNQAYLCDESGKALKSSVKNIQRVSLEAILGKTVYEHGESEALKDNFNVAVNQVIDNYISFYHYGQGSYDNLPMVDDISGGQSLLVSVADNTALASEGLSKVTVDEEEYYKLNKPGTYKNVVVGEDEQNGKFIADTIKVTDSGSGLDTQIKWYFSHIDGGSYSLMVCYKTIVDFDILKSTDYSISNKAWMNDRQENRLYATTFGGGSLLSFNKEIVYKNDDDTYTVDDDDYSAVAIGESVNYRLTLSNPNDFLITITGDNILDNLPTNGELFSWEKDINVSLTWQEMEGVTAENVDNWSIEKDSGSYIGQYNIKWASDTSITIQPDKNFYMYVKLDFPSDSTIWKSYCSYMKGDKVYNTFKVYDYPDSVSHSLKGKGEVLFQKGVYSTLRYSISNQWIRCVETSSRVYYNNRDYTNRAIMYYVVLYNNGDNRLYLTDMQDKLPEGFTYLTLNSNNSSSVNQYASNSMITSNGTSNFLVDIKNSSLDDMKFLSVNVNCEQNSDGTLSFKFSKIEQGNTAVKYDEIKDKLYLERGEAIAFSYICDIGLTEDSFDRAVNTIAMNYYDYLNAGVSAVSEEDITVNGKLNDKHIDQNDGTRIVEDAENVSTRYGFSGSGKWLISDVAVSRGGIIPGITNYTDSYVDTNGNVIQYVNDAPPQATVNWSVKMHNSGFRSITDYTVIDTLPVRYSLTGSLNLNIYDNTQSTAIKSFENFITVLSERTTDDDSIKIKTNQGSTEYSLPLDGTEITIPIVDGNKNAIYISISITTNDNGQEVLSIHFADKGFSIPEDGGYVELSLSGVNVTGQIVNTVYTNTAVLVPNKQIFSSTTQGSLVYDNNGEALIGTTNNSPLNISFGTLTSALKEVFEINNTSNKTDSNQSKNYITLSDKNSEFRYVLSVENETNSTMKKLVLIDTLPKLNDTSPFDSTAPRGSEFAVHLSENPNFEIKITYSNGTTKILGSSEYEIGFKTDTSLTSSDWQGTSTWSESSENAEAIRFIIDNATLIENKAVVEIGFNVKADNDAVAGTKAWNSFGYHYVLDNSQNTELEAMPLSVGVQIPETPLIQKDLVDIEGNIYKVKQDTTFSFLIYQGEKYSGEYSNSDELIQALEIAGTPYQKIDLIVKSGESTASQKLEFGYDKLKFIDGQKYTMVELLTDNKYKLDSWNYISQDSVSFTYSSDKSVTLLCKNIYTEWKIKLIKADSENSEIKLENAKFAIYSPNKGDQLSDSDYEALGINAEKEISYDDKSWYIAGVQSTDSNGEIIFESLCRDKYCILEVASPDGYILTAEPKIVTNNSLLQNIEIFNHKAPILPEAGSKGIINFISFGMGMILTIAVFMLVNKLKQSRKIK